MVSKKFLTKNRLLYIILLCVILSGCTKYSPGEPIKDAAYIRVFNSIASGVEPTDIGGINPFLTFLMDPEKAADSAFIGAPVMCDYLNTRRLASQSYPTDADTDPSAPVTVIGSPNGAPVYTGILNFEYPGKAHVPAAPAMNGFDMSSWAQVKPGRHRIVFVVRPKNDVPFSEQDERVRKNILIDTVVELKPGEVYTLEAIQTNRETPVQYGLYMRTENFYKQSFEADKIYVGFDNISGNYPLAAQHGFLNLFADTMNIYYSYLMRDVVVVPPTGIYSNVLTVMNMKDLFFTTISSKRQGRVTSYLSLPLLPRSYFFYKDSTLKTFPSTLQQDNYFTNGVQKDEDLPFVRFDFYNYNASQTKVFSLNCSASPVTLQYYDQSNPYVRRYLPNLNLIVNNKNRIHIYPTVAILEICYDRIYMMQMQRAFNEVPQ